MAATTRGLRRKVLLRDDFGLCISWPKTHWRSVSGLGKTTSVLIDGQPRRVKVESERCNCRGRGWHEHRFLALPDTVGAHPSQVVSVALPMGDHDAAAPEDVLTLSAGVDEVNEAALYGRPLSASRRRTLGRFLARRQGLPGCYCGLFAPVGDELCEGYRVFTGERIRSGGGARHILGEESLRALILLEQAEPPGGQTLVRVAIRRASDAMGQRLAQHEARPKGGGRGLYCCHRCSVALWRTLAVGGFGGDPDRLACGLRRLQGRRNGRGQWRGFPFSYTISALVDAELPESRAELAYARPALERRLSRRDRDVHDPYASRRRALFERALVLAP